MLSALKVPSAGGETQLADARAGYDALSADLKASIEELGAYHSTEFSQANDLGDFPKEIRVVFIMARPTIDLL